MGTIKHLGVKLIFETVYFRPVVTRTSASKSVRQMIFDALNLKANKVQ